MSIGSRIKEARIKMKLERNDLAKILGISSSSISNYENDISSPKEPILYKLLDALKIDANYLFQDEMAKYANGKANSATNSDKNLSTLQKKLINKIENMGQDELYAVASFLKTLEEYSFARGTNASETDDGFDIEEEVNDYERQLQKEKSMVSSVSREQEENVV